jgi:F-type H+-transporting ATPase subunit b
MTELLSDSHFWIGVAFVIFAGILVRFGVPKLLVGMLDDQAAKVRHQLDEATRLREESQALLASIVTQRQDAERMAAEMLANAELEAKRLQVEAQAKLEEQIVRRQTLAERKIATAEAAAAAEVKAAAGELAAQMAEAVLIGRATGAKSDPLIDRAVDQLAGKFQ